MQPAATTGARVIGQSRHDDDTQWPIERLKRGSALTITGQGVKLILQLGSMAILARVLSPADFGLYSLVTPIAAFFLMFQNLGLTSATIYTDDITGAEVTSLFWISTAAGVVLGALLLLCAPLAASIYDDARLVPVLSVLATTFVCNGIAAQYQALFQRHFRFRVLVGIEVGSFAGGTLIGVVAATQGLQYWSLVLIPVATQAIGLIATMMLSAWQPGAPRWESRTGMMARFGSNIAGFNVLNYFARNLDNLLIGKVWGLNALGYYGRAYGLLMAPLSQIIYPLNKVVVPILTRINRDRDAYVRTYRQILSVVMLVCCPLVTWLIVARNAVVEVFLGPQWHSVAPIFLALGFAALVQPVNNATGWLLLSQGRARDILISGVLACTVALTSFICGLPWGAIGVASAYAIAQVFVITPALWWLVCRQGFVRASVLGAIALPAWSAAAIAGMSFEMSRPWLPVALHSPLWLLVCSCIWIAMAYIAALAVHARGRTLLHAAVPARMLNTFKPA